MVNNKINILYDKTSNITIMQGSNVNCKKKNILCLYEVSWSVFFPRIFIPQVRTELIKLEILRNLPKVKIEKNELFIHIRGGDIFKSEIENVYAQPPLCFYEKILNNSKNFKNIYIISMDRANVVVDALLQKYKNIIHNINDFEYDISLLCHAYNIVLSVSSFALSSIKLNENLKNLWEFDIMRLSTKFLFLHHYIFKFKIKYKIHTMKPSDKYINKMFKWINSKEQYKLMLEDECPHDFVITKINIFFSLNLKKFKSVIVLFIFFFFLLNNKQNDQSLSHLIKNVPKISIFIPIYNKENYIHHSIGSLQNQSLKDIEIIAVNDCSNDTSLSILNNLAQKDNRIKVINNDKNHGLLYSRAMGILNSSGDYLMDLDPDDIINDNESLEYLYNQSQLTKVDIIQFSVFFKDINWTYKCTYNKKILRQPKLFKSIFSKSFKLTDSLIVNKLIKKEIFLKAYEDFSIAIYNGNWNYFEDNIWNILVNKYAKSKLCIDKLVYIYNNNNDSLTKNRYTEIEFRNLLYGYEIYKHIFQKESEKKYLIAESYVLFNKLKSDLKFLLLINDNSIKTHIKSIFKFVLNNYAFSLKTRNDINNFLKSIH